MKLLLPIVLMCCGCEAPASVPSSMSAADLKSLEASLERLDKVLSEKVPAIHANLAPGATNAEIADLRAGLEGNQIEALEVWFRWHNGCMGTPCRFLPLGDPLSIQQALEDRRMIREIALVGNRRKAVIKILVDGAGDGFFLDITSSAPKVFYEMLEDPYPRYYGTLEEFADFITAAFDSGAITVNQAGEFDYDSDRYDELEAAHLKQISDN